MRVRVVAELRSTEDPEKVTRALSKLFPSLRFELKSFGQRQVIEGESDQIGALSYLKENLRRRKVRAAAERIMRSFSGGNLVHFMLSKQAAYVGTASLLELDELPEIGWIDVFVEAEDAEEVIRWLTER
ncbi:MAG: RNA-binding domain-containing protein [Nitrososphaerota archaeon]